MTQQDLIVQLQTGQVRGSVANGVAVFKGIPYAASPVGAMRWRAPQPVVAWDGIRDATSFCPDCIQSENKEAIQTTPSEDCLFVNIWTPAEIVRDDLLPVLVWVHGGGYVGGGSSIPYYDGTSFARQGIVVVSVNYRLTRLGFFAHPALSRAAEGPVGNYGYLDQIAALEWVRDQISLFGGDPGRVTLMGESAGGASVLHLMTSPLVGDLFQQAVILSGGGREAIVVRDMSNEQFGVLDARQTDSMFALPHGIIGDGERALDRLRNLDASTLAGDLTLKKLITIKLLGGPLPGVPVKDGELIVGEPQDHFLDGTSKQIPVIIGSTAIDLPLMFPPDKSNPLPWFGEHEAAAARAYGVDGAGDLDLEETVKLLLDIAADMTMHEPAHFVASTMKAAGEPAWVYRFTYTAESTRPETMAQVHGGELPFLFDTLDARFGDATTDSDRKVARAFNTYVGNFIKQSDPNATGLPDWPQVGSEAFNLLHFTLDDGPVFMADPRLGVPLVAKARQAHLAESNS